MQQLLRISRVIDSFNERIGRLTYWILPLMIMIGVWNVVGRYLGRFIGENLSSNGFIETQWYLFDLVFLLGAAYTLKHNGHVRVDVFYKSLKPKAQAIANLIGTLLFLIPFCIMVIYFSWGAIVNSWTIQEMSPDPGGLPRYPIKSMIIVSFGLLILQGISEAIKNWAIFAGYLAPQEED
ncbi:C4-dicarboxylate ABC transporter substrate-binding protein [Moorena producens PAL-8-15-08-1]|uniref:C4-dicarboxylate ABC transporter substrate-binding protein n=1 Tax=Moorena producens PAL-8-15-08-1 TaxID=1458985 RepID=A0A1D8U348_9CYAN|nr:MULTISPECIES: TRAP transporter small permease subunit [Moorena]AOX04298.1 C4-dicarboxylate ABC transporter substrate-binding protein [Moorena producens PAL-8-15-08-1]NEO76764.1 TRAP transporter small permease subunit [Moorena sp. SIO4G3]